MGQIAGVKPFPPGVFASYGNGWRQLWKYFPVLLLIGIIYFVISVAISIPQYVVQFSTGNDPAALGTFAAVWSVISVAFSIFVIGPLGYGLYYAYLKAARGDITEIRDMFAGFNNYWSAVGSYLLLSIIIGIGFLFFIIPGIYFACQLAFVPYLIVDKKMRVSEAFRQSWRMAADGRGWKVFLIGLLAIPVFIAGLIVIGVGVIISIMWITMALSSLYHAIDSRRQALAAEVPTTAPPTGSP